MPNMRRSVESRIREIFRSAKRVNGCLEAHLKPNNKGYIPFQPEPRVGKVWRLHRFIYHLLWEPVTDKDLVLHSCDNRQCINILHLRKGTPSDNVADMFARGRARNQWGPIKYRCD